VYFVPFSSSQRGASDGLDHFANFHGFREIFHYEHVGFLAKDNVDVLALFLVELFNRSMALGVVLSVFKAAYITPLLKKADLDPTDAKSYRPISNLTVLSKLLERLIARQLLDYLTASRLLPELQSACRANHSTETAVLRVLADILPGGRHRRPGVADTARPVCR